MPDRTSDNRTRIILDDIIQAPHTPQEQGLPQQLHSSSGYLCFLEGSLLAITYPDITFYTKQKKNTIIHSYEPVNMKQVVSLLTLGMSTLVAAEHQITHKAIFKDTSQISMDETGTVSVSVASGSELTCEALVDDGSAYPDYTDFQSNATSVDAPTRNLYAKGTTLAYRCGIRNMTSQENYQFNEPPILFDSLQTGEFIRVDFSGSCTADSLVFTAASVTNNGTYDGGRNFTADITTQLTYGCKQGKVFSPSVTAEVMLEPLSVATFVQDGVFSKSIDGFTTTDGLVFNAAKSLLFDLGTDKSDQHTTKLLSLASLDCAKVLFFCHLVTQRHLSLQILWIH